MIFRGLLCLVVLSPLPFGAVHSWSSSVVVVGSSILLVAWALEHILRGRAPAVGLRRAWGIVLLFGLTLAWAALQIAPFTPASWHHPLWQEAALALGEDIRSSISLDPSTTLDASLRLFAYGAIFWLALEYGRSERRARSALRVLCWSGLAYATYGIAILWIGDDKVLWLNKPAFHGDVTSTFLNRNAFAAYAGLCLLCATALAAKAVDNSIAAMASRRELARQLIVGFGRGGWLLALAGIVIWSSVLLSHSRAGIVATILGLGVLLATLFGKRLRRGRFVAGVLALSLIGVAFAALFGGEVDRRFTLVGDDATARLSVFELTLESIAKTPFTGTGFGTFAQVYGLEREPGMDDVFLRAHNIYLENALELGIPAAASLIAALALVAWRCARGVRERQFNAVYPALGLGATALVGSHALVDFSLQVPAVAVTYTFIIGVAYAQSWSTRSQRDAW